MRLLLDTHAFLWWVDGGTRLTPKARAAIARAGNECFVSVATAWEIAIKQSIGKLKLQTPLERFMPQQLAINGFGLLGIDLRHATRVATLPFHHRDPFDRLLAAQAIEETLTVVSADAVFGRYGVARIW
jgi:PIN domain nuclease of toxin-antitoxin system